MDSEQNEDMLSFSMVMGRIQHVTATRTQVALAEILGIRQSSISDAKKRNAIPATWYVSLFNRLGVNPDWLKTGVGPIYLRGERGYAPCDDVGMEPAMLVDPLCKPVQRTVYSMQGLHLGEGDVLSQFRRMGRIVLPEVYAVEGCVVFGVENDAMAPVIRKGAHVGIDTCRRSPISGLIFAFIIPYEGLVLRRLFYEKGMVLLRAEGAFPEQRLSADDLEQQLFGKVAWVLQQE